MDVEKLAQLLEGLNLSETPQLKCKDCNCFVCQEWCAICKEDCQCMSVNSLPDDSYVRQPGIFFKNYDTLQVKISGQNIANLPSPITDFESFKELPCSIFKLFYKKPTPVQKSAIPLMIQGLDLVVCAQTGSGKTAAFLIPIIVKVLSKPTTKQPYAFILTPTRELAIQIHRDAVRLTKETHIKCCCVYGGKDISENIANINAGCDILIGTLGRVEGILKILKSLLSTVQIFVLDEGDHMLGSNFISDIEKLNKNYLPAKENRQTVLFCATLPDDFCIDPKVKCDVDQKVVDNNAKVNTEKDDTDDKEIKDNKAVESENKKVSHNNAKIKNNRTSINETLKKLLKDDYIFISVGSIDGTVNFIDQSFIKVQNDTPKIKMLIDILVKESIENRKTVVFVETKKETRKLAKFLCCCGFKVTVFHKDRCQRDREEALHQFNTGVKPIMICTSVSARGLDIIEVKTVINYDLPQDISTYLYRIGRTGRAGHAGKSISFFVENRDDPIARGLVKNLSMSEQEVPEWLECIAENATGTAYGSRAGKFASKDSRKAISTITLECDFSPANNE
ncbi:probable ATP-dependent RNA helicase DDX4 isoform X2 [Hydra vulgaris]|uniref:RNA helicase n=1 Tax=Hydra vulgaris TaxID=6087 RepID=A0ABM4BCK9_HYDVU